METSTRVEAELYDQIYVTALKLAEIRTHGIHLEIDAINNSKAKNCNIVTKEKIR